MAKEKVGKYVNTHFVSAFQKVATFQINGNQKQGGNVASYFCAPDGRVLHVVAGPVDAGTLLREAKWVVENTQRPPGRTNPPLVATAMDPASPLQVFRAWATSRSLCPVSRSSRQYASAVSSSVAPALSAAWITAIPCDGSRGSIVESRIQPSPIIAVM